MALQLADPQRVLKGLRITIRRGKTNQDGAGAAIAIDEGRRLRPKALLQAWLDRAELNDGPLFRRLSAAGAVTAARMPDRAAADFAGHPLYAGFPTAAACTGASVLKMREVSQRKSMQVLADYVRDAELFRDHAGEGFV
jgi:hypothetical protein